MHGFGQADVARIASAFLVPGRGPGHVLSEYRAMRERIERAHIQRRRALLRRLRAQWAGRGVTLVPMFTSLTQGYSPAQIERLRGELARNGDIEATFRAIEQANIKRGSRPPRRRFAAGRRSGRRPARPARRRRFRSRRRSF